MTAIDMESTVSPVATTTSAGTHRLKALLKYAGALAIIVVLVRGVGVQDVLSRIGGCPPKFAFAAFVLTLVAYWLAAYRLRLLARSQAFELPRSEALLVFLSATFYGLFVPGGSATGWAVRLTRLARVNGRVAPALQLLAGDRALSTAAGAAIGLVTASLVSDAASGWTRALLFAVTTGATLLCVALFTSVAESPLAWARRLPLVARLADKVAASQSLLRRPDRWTVLLAAILSVASHGLGVLAWLALAYGIGLTPDPLLIAWVRSVSMVATLLPASIGGLGLRDGTVVYLMVFVGVAASDALALSLLVFATTIFAVGIVGGALEACNLLGRRR